MRKSKEEVYKREAEKSKNRFSTSFYYVDTDKAERLGLTEYKAVAGKDIFMRIISPDLDEFWALEIHKHSNIGPNRATFLCLEKMFEKECPICEMIKELREKDPKDEKIGALRCTRRYLVFLYDVENAETERKGLRFCDMPVTVKDNIMSLCVDKRTGKFTEIEHPEDGKDIEFRRVGTTLENTKYSGFKLVDNDPVPKEWTEDVPKFDDILRIPKPEDVQKELLGMASGTSEEPGPEEVEEREERRESARGRRSREEETEEVEVQETEEEKETPRKSRRSRGSDESNESSTDEKESRRDRARKKAEALKAKISARNEK